MLREVFMIRTVERKQLEKLYRQKGRRSVLLYGGSRSEVTSLVREFIKDKPSFYYMGRNASEKEQLFQLQRETEAFTSLPAEGTYEKCFSAVFSSFPSQGEDPVIVIDGFDAAVRHNLSFLDALKSLAAGRLCAGSFLLVLCVHSLTFVRSDPMKLFGENRFFDTTLRAEDDSFLDLVRAFPEYSVRDAVSVYGVIGGVPAYVSLWEKNQTVRENICRLILTPGGALFSEAEAYIGSELREPAVYETILASIARGNEKLNDLFEDTGFSRAKISVYLKNLSAFNVTEKAVSFETGGWKNTKKGVYRIAEPFLAFWFTFVYPHLSERSILTSEEFYDRFIAPEIEDYLSGSFVRVCMEYLKLLNMVGQLPIRAKRFGSWYGKNGTIDLIGEDETRRRVVGICSWNEEKMPYESYEKLLLSMKEARIRADVVYLFSAHQFDDRITSLSKEDSSVILVDMTEL